MNSALSAAIEQVEWPSAAAIVTITPFLKGLVSEAERKSCACVAFLKSERNLLGNHSFRDSLLYVSF